MDDKLRNSLDRLNEEQTSHLLEKDIKFDIDKRAVARIKSSVCKKVKVNKKPSVFSRRLIACASAVILVFCTISAVGFDNVAAAVQQVIQYIPGFGRVPEDAGRDVLEVKVMKEPAFIEVQGAKVEIHSSWLSIYKDQVIVTAILLYPQNINFNGEITIKCSNQKIYRDSEYPDYASSVDNKGYREITYVYTIKNPKTSIDTLTFETEGSKSKVNINFKRSDDVKDKIVSQNFGGIVVSAIPLNKDKSKFILTTTYEKNMKGIMFISSLVSGPDSQIRAVDESGSEYEVKKSTSQGSEYYVDGDIKGKIVSLKFNRLYQGFICENSKSLHGVKFIVPRVGEKVNINKSLENSLNSINLKSVEKVKSTDKAPFNLVFTYEIKSKIPGLAVSNMALYVEKTGGMIAGTILERYKEGNSDIVKYGVLADEGTAENTVTIVPYSSYYWNTLLLDKECVLKFQ